MIDFCKKCGKKRLIINKKYFLCTYCNGVRLNSQSNSNVPNDDYNKLSKSKHIKNKKIKSISKIESKNKKKLKKVYQEIDEFRHHICSGCGQTEMLSHSHIISQKNKKLQYDKNNIVFHCMERKIPDNFGKLGCHARWESGQWDKIITLNNYKNHLAYLKINDLIKFNKIKLTANE